MGYNKRARKIDPNYTAQNASSHESDKKKIQNRKDLEEKDIQDDERSERSEYTSESKKKDSAHDGCDRGRSISSENDTESTSSQEEEKKGWIEYSERSAEEADEKMQTYNNTNRIETQRKLKWRQAVRIATQSEYFFDQSGTQALYNFNKNSKESRKTDQEMGRRPE